MLNVSVDNTNLIFYKNVNLRDLTTFQVGGKAQYFCVLKTKNDVLQAVLFAKEKKLPIFVIGEGSNILINDSGFKGLVIKFRGNKVSFTKRKGHVLVKAQAGLKWDRLVKICVDKNLQGIECLSGIPGTVGASPIQNIGAYGQELKDTFVKLIAFDFKEQKFVTFSKNDCKFSYRSSIFKIPRNIGRYLITEVFLMLKKNATPTLTYKSLTDYFMKKNVINPTLKEVRKAVLYLRRKKLENPKFVGNAGSFFKNPFVGKKIFKALIKKYPDMPFYEDGENRYKLFAGWLIDKAGWRGKGIGGARVSSKNALVITNYRKKATAKDIKKLSEVISSDIYNKFGIKLEPEVQFIGFD